MPGREEDTSASAPGSWVENATLQQEMILYVHLSPARLHLPNYSARAVSAFLERAGVDLSDYARTGIFVPRATLMNPSLTLAAETGHKQAMVGDFVERVAAAPEELIGVGVADT